jgi:hypothetical protein
MTGSQQMFPSSNMSAHFKALKKKEKHNGISVKAIYILLFF